MGPTAEYPSQVTTTPRAGWYDDPEWPGQKRYWDGTRWIDRRVPAPPVAAPVRTRATPAGWYDDPATPGTTRYWDGTRWTDQRRLPARPASPVVPVAPVPPAASPPPAPAAPPAGWYDDPAAPGGTRYWDGTQWSPAPTSPPVGVSTVPTDVTGAAGAALGASADRVPPSAQIADDEAEAEAAAEPEAVAEADADAAAAAAAAVEVEAKAAAAAAESAPEPLPPAPDTVAEVGDTDATPGAEAGSLEPEAATADLESGGVGAALPTAADEYAVEALEPDIPPPPPGSSGVPVSSGFRLPPPEEPSDLPASVGVDAPWYRRRATWLIGGLALIGVLVLVTLRACGGPQGATPEPGVFRGSGDDGFAIEFTVTPAGDITDLEFDARSDTITMEGAHVDETLPVDDGTFDVSLRDGLGLQVITIEGRFTDGGTAATGSFHIELAPGVQVQSGGDPNASGSWRAELTGGG